MCLKTEATVELWDINSRANITTIQFASGIISHCTYPQINRIVIGLNDGSVQLWKCSNEDRLSWELQWSSETEQPNPGLYLSGCNFINARGLTDVDKRLILQHSGIVDVKNFELPSTAKQSGSPLYHKPEEKKQEKNEKCVLF